MQNIYKGGIILYNMKREKKVLIFGIVLGIVIISVIYVIAQSDLEGELAEAKTSTARVDVVLNTPPIVLFVSYLNYSGPVLIPTGGAIFLNYSFVAYSAGGNSQLPQTPAQVATNVKGGFNGTFGNTVPRMKTTPSISCGMAGEIPNLIVISPAWNGKEGINYTCVVRMLYYYDPGTWSINASVMDIGGRTGYNNSKTFAVQDNPAWVMAPNYVNWSSISLDAAAAHSSNNLTINNTGNVNISAAAGNAVRVNATFLNGTGLGPGQTAEGIMGDKFKASEYGTCNSGTDLLNSNFVTIASPVAFVIDHESSTEDIPSKKNLTFCIETLSGISPQRYETQLGQSWTIETALG